MNPVKLGRGSLFFFFSSLLILLIAGAVQAGPLYKVGLEKVGCTYHPFLSPFTFNANCDAYIQVRVTNNGDAECTDCQVEAGIYQRDLVNNWYGGQKVLASGLNVLDIPNCVSGESWVDDAKVHLKPGETTLVNFYITAPNVALTGTQTSGAFGIHTQAYRKCWSAGVDVGQMSFAVAPVTIYPSTYSTSDPVPSCNDGQINQDESDKDCGGSHCAKCGLEYRCKSNDDCQTGYCQFFYTSNSYKCATPPPVPVPPPQPGNCGNGKVDPGEDCTTCRQDLPANQCTGPVIPPCTVNCTGGTHWYDDPITLIVVVIGGMAVFLVGKRIFG